MFQGGNSCDPRPSFYYFPFTFILEAGVTWTGFFQEHTKAYQFKDLLNYAV
jgi:hypothetical protein